MRGNQIADPTAVAATATAVSLELPWWVAWVKEGAADLAAPALAVFAAVIAYKRSRIAAAKVKLDLFEKRFKVFDAARTLIVEHSTVERISDEDHKVFLRATSDAEFLFDGEVPEYLDSLSKNSIRVVSRRLFGSTCPKKVSA